MFLELNPDFSNVCLYYVLNSKGSGLGTCYSELINSLSISNDYVSYIYCSAVFIQSYLIAIQAHYSLNLRVFAIFVNRILLFVIFIFHFSGLFIILYIKQINFSNNVQL